MNWAVWKLRNHIVYTEGIQGINPSSRQTVSSHQDNIDTFLCGVNRSAALQKLAPKLANQLYYFMRCSEQDDEILNFNSIKIHKRWTFLRNQTLNKAHLQVASHEASIVKKKRENWEWKWKVDKKLC